MPRYKCRGSLHRWSFPKSIEHYVIEKKCKICLREGKSGKLYLDKSGMRRDKRLLCKCSGVPHPHRQESYYGCEHYTGERSKELDREFLDQMKERMKTEQGY